MNALDGPPWPSTEWVSQAVREGRGWVEVGPEVPLDDGHPAAMLDFLRFLRDATTHGLQVAWRSHLGTGVPIAAIAHLPPPNGGTDLALNPAAAVWRERFRPDSFIWRQGPGFILLMDTRPGGPPRRYRLTEPDVLHVFQQLQTPRAFAEPRLEAPIAALDGARAVLKLDGLALALPVHQIRPPVVYRRTMHTFASAFDVPVES